MIEPFPESALNEQAGKMLLENYEEYARHAKLVIPSHYLLHVVVYANGGTFLCLIFIVY